jgi:DNA-binding CsgD family transcriptional regulator
LLGRVNASGVIWFLLTAGANNRRHWVQSMTGALTNASQLSPADVAQSLALEALNALAVGVLFTTADGSVLHANRAAREVAAQRDGFSLSERRVTSSSPRQNKKLRILLAQAARPGATMSAICLPRSSQCRPYILLIAPLPQTRRGELTPITMGEQPVLVFIRDPESGFALSSSDVCTVLGLTPAEARVLIAIADGASLADASAALGITKNTVRSHLQHIFIKTGVSRQSELVLLASKLSFAYCGRPGAGQLQ